MCRHFTSVSLLAILLLPFPVFPAEPLPDTRPLTADGDLAASMVDGIHKYLDRESAASVEKRKAFWKPDFSSAEAYGKSVQPNRERLRKYLGVVDARLPPRMEYAGGPGEPSLVAETEKFAVHLVRWAVLPGVDGEGLLLEPKAQAIANVVALPDADQTPEQVCGLAPGSPPPSQFARRLAENGCRVVVPVLIDRKDEWSGNARLKRQTNQPHREFVHRMAYEMGRTLTGYEVQKTLAAVDWFQEGRRKNGTLPVGVFGYGAGGRVALLSAALDERIAAAVVSGVFGPREKLADEPIDHNVWGLLTEFGDGELLRLVFPRPVIAEAAPFVIPGPQPARPGRAGAAPGRYASPGVLAAKSEMARGLLPLINEWKLPRKQSHTYAGGPVETGRGDDDATAQGPGLPSTYASFLGYFAGKPVAAAGTAEPAPVLRRPVDAALRQKRQFDQLVAFTQKLWRDSEPIRKARSSPRRTRPRPRRGTSPSSRCREFFHAEVIGKLPEPIAAAQPAHAPGVRRADLAGLRGDARCPTPTCSPVGSSCCRRTSSRASGGRWWSASTASKAPRATRHRPREADRLVYTQFAGGWWRRATSSTAPQNPYYGENAFRQLSRKANPLKLSLFSFIVRQHQRTLDWLETLPIVDPKRIAFYGLSYGGKTAMRVPAVEKRYCLSDLLGRLQRVGRQDASRRTATAATCGRTSTRCTSSTSATRSTTPRWRP